jgi:hypothetical protein
MATGDDILALARHSNAERTQPIGALTRVASPPAVRSVPDLDAAGVRRNIEQAARNYEKSFEAVSSIIAQQSQIPRQ